MFISNALNKITKISDDEKINFDNYMESLDYITNLHRFILLIKESVSLSEIKFLPSFKGKYTAEKLGLETSISENEMKVIKITSKLLLEDKKRKVIAEKLEPLCEKIVWADEVMIFYLK